LTNAEKKIFFNIGLRHKDPISPFHERQNISETLSQCCNALLNLSLEGFISTFQSGSLEREKCTEPPCGVFERTEAEFIQINQGVCKLALIIGWESFL